MEGGRGSGCDCRRSARQVEFDSGEGVAIEGIEAVLLAGGASRRMGEDKALISIEGVALGQRIVDAFLQTGVPVTLLGGPRLEGAQHLEDARPFSGPLAALSAFAPAKDFVFVSSCDLPVFDPALVAMLTSAIGSREGAVPVIAERAQPLCALYTAAAIERSRSVFESGRRNVMAWLDELDWIAVLEGQFEAFGISPQAACGVNTQQELREALQRAGLR